MCMADQIVCLVCGCRIKPYRDIEGYVSIHMYRNLDRWFCPNCDSEVLV